MDIAYEDVYKNEEKVMLKNGIIVPPRLYKIIKCNTKDASYTSGFVFHNDSRIQNENILKQYEIPWKKLKISLDYHSSLREDPV